jgi:hypothetical protein
MDDYFSEPLQARFYFTMEGCTNDEGITSHGDLPHFSLSDSILERDWNGVHVFFNPSLDLAQRMARHFEICRRTSLAFTMVMFVLSGLSSTTSLDT